MSDPPEKYFTLVLPTTWGKKFSVDYGPKCGRENDKYFSTRKRIHTEHTHTGPTTHKIKCC